MYVLILAGGEGKRMESSLPKVLHHFHGKPMIVCILETVLQLNPEVIYIVVGKHQSRIKETLDEYFPLRIFLFIEQSIPLGTGDAVYQVLPYLPSNNNILILNGDTPNLHVGVLEEAIATENCVLSMELDSPKGYGRIITDEKGLVKIIEEKDANETEKKIKLVNSGIYYFHSSVLQNLIPKITSKNAQSEFYLTDVVSLCRYHDIMVHTKTIPTLWKKYIMGVNTKADLEELQKL